MTPPVRPEKDHLTALRENLDYLRGQGASKAELQAEIQRWAHVLPPAVVARQKEFAEGRLESRMASENALDRAQMLSGASETGAILSGALENATFGLSGIVDDAISAMGQGTFRAARDARKDIREAVPASSRTIAAVSGGLLNPANLAVPGSFFTGSLLKAGAAGAFAGGANAASQYVGENVGTTDGVDPVELGMSTAAGVVGGGLLTPAMARATRPADDAVGRRLLDPMMADRGTQVTPPTGPGLPEPMALDVVGPQTLATLRGATGTTRGREALKTVLEAREAQMGPALRHGIEDAEATRAALIQTREAIGNDVYGKAIEATKGAPVTGRAVDDFLSTPVGKAAWKIVQTNRPNRVVGTGDPARALPTAPQWKGPDLVDEPLPDAEAIHEMKRLVSEWGSADKDFDFPEGVSAIAAKDALLLFGRIRDLMPAPFRDADAAYEAASAPLNALELGMKKWKGNIGAKRKAEALTLVENAIKAMDPNVAQVVREAKQFDVANRITNKALNVEKAAGLLKDPGSDLSRELAIAGGDLPERIPAWAEAARRKGVVLPSGALANTPDRSTILSKVIQSLGPTPRVTAARTGRTVGGELTEESLEQLGKEDEEIVKLLTGKPDALRKYLAKYRKASNRQQTAAALTAGTSGRVGSLLGSNY